MSILNLARAVSDALEESDLDRVRELWSEMESWLGGDVQFYTPGITSSGTAVNLGTSPTQTGFYRVFNGNMVYGSAVVAFGTSPTVGTGTYYFDLPFPVYNPGTFANNMPIGSGRVWDDSLSDSYLVVPEIVWGAHTDKCRLMWDEQVGADGVLTYNNPVTWAAADAFQFTFQYIAEGLVI